MVVDDGGIVLTGSVAKYRDGQQQLVFFYKSLATQNDNDSVTLVCVRKVGKTQISLHQ
jgi:hypothetical protein